MITDYLVLRKDCNTTLGISVVRLIKEGWQPLGGVCMSFDKKDQMMHYAQTMIKHAEKAGAAT